MPVLRGDHPRPDLALDDPECEVAIGRQPLIIATALPQRGESQREILAPLAHRIKRIPRALIFSTRTCAHASGTTCRANARRRLK